MSYRFQGLSMSVFSLSSSAILETRQAQSIYWKARKMPLTRENEPALTLGGELRDVVGAGMGMFPRVNTGCWVHLPWSCCCSICSPGYRGWVPETSQQGLLGLLQVQSCLTEIHAQGRDLQWGTVWHCRKGPAILTKLYTTLRSQYLGFRVHCGLWVTRFNLPFFQRCEVKRILYQLPCMLSWLWVAYLVTQYTFCVSKATQGWSWELGFVTVLLTHCQVT